MPDAKSASRKQTDVDPTKLLRRKQAADLIGISYSEFCRREDLGILKPTKIDSKGHKVYDQAYLAKQHRSLKLMPPPHRGLPVAMNNGPDEAPRIVGAMYDEADAKAAFEAFDEGRQPIDVVKQLGVHPRKVVSLHADWIAIRAMSGGFFVRGEISRKLDDLPLDVSTPIRSDEALLAYLKNVASTVEPSPKCQHCHRLPRQFCASCVEKTLAAATAASAANNGGS